MYLGEGVYMLGQLTDPLCSNGGVSWYYSCVLARSRDCWGTMLERSWMTGGPVEATLGLRASSARDVRGRIRSPFRQERMAISAGLFLDALLGPERRGTGRMRAGVAGDPGPWPQ